GLGYFDGTHLYEHADRRQGFHPDWGSLIFNYDRNEVRSFLLSSAVSWLDRYHVDGIRVDAVASMLYLDYSRDQGDWIPNRYGGRENLGAIGFLRELNRIAYGEFPGVQTFAEESTAWPNVSRPLEVGGLGFGFKWDMGWMHDTLAYLARDPVHRRFHHRDLTFRGLYAFTENFCLPLSHDEVVHGKGSLLNKMAGDDWQKFANLRLLLAYQFAVPGKKLLFMGGEIAQRAEWNHDTSLDWHLLDHTSHRGIRSLVQDLARLYRMLPALHVGDNDPDGMDWISADDSDASALTFLRRTPGQNDYLLALFNFTPVPRYDFVVGAPASGLWREILNTDAGEYWGSGVGNGGALLATGHPHGRHPDSLRLTLPPLGAIFLNADG
ncbi:MAG: 1,4-alpha-glucan branching enzyme, partial [Acidimicrobiia bacterium]|nr:1,4-alpha-glucan branching enzyme [Acidimicrobiia bacterium]